MKVVPKSPTLDFLLKHADHAISFQSTPTYIMQEAPEVTYDLPAKMTLTAIDPATGVEPLDEAPLTFEELMMNLGKTDP